MTIRYWINALLPSCAKTTERYLLLSSQTSCGSSTFISLFIWVLIRPTYPYTFALNIGFSIIMLAIASESTLYYYWLTNILLHISSSRRDCHRISAAQRDKRRFEIRIVSQDIWEHQHFIFMKIPYMERDFAVCGMRRMITKLCD